MKNSEIFYRTTEPVSTKLVINGGWYFYSHTGEKDFSLDVMV